MKKALIILLTALLYCSCETERVTSEHIDTLTDPNQFIGKSQPIATVLGVFHFHNPGLDVYKSKYDADILSVSRQKELNEVIEKLAIYNPTKILIEVPRISADSIINDRYTKYLNGEFDISDKRNEIYQLAFKLAKRLGHKKIYASDTERLKWFGADIDWDHFDEDEYAKSLGQYEKANRYPYEQIYELQDSLKTSMSLIEYLVYLNNPQNRLKDHQAYLTEDAVVGAGDNYMGADMLARWYQRNLRIFANTYDIADFNNEERLLLIYGAGHVWQLRQFLSDSPDFDYLEVNEILKK